MRYVFELTIPANTPTVNPEELEVALTTGIITHMEIAFPPGGAWMVKVVVRDGLFQVSPANPDSYHAWDDFTEIFSMNYPLMDPNPILTLVGWSPNTVFDHTVTFRFDVTPKGQDDRSAIMEAFFQAANIEGMI